MRLVVLYVEVEYNLQTGMVVKGKTSKGSRDGWKGLDTVLESPSSSEIRVWSLFLILGS